jgi:hypothetical protein
MTFDEAALDISQQVARLVVKKQKDYGPANIIRSVVKPELAIAVRLNDKVARLANLAQTQGEPNNESLMDTAYDIMGYGLVLAMVLDNKFTLPLEDIDELPKI